MASIEAAAVAGIVCAVGWALSLRSLLRTPGISATETEIASFYAEQANSTAKVAWLQVFVLSTLAFLWFIGVVRGRVGDREPKLFGTVFFGASILFAALLFVGASFLASPAVMVLGDGVPAPGSVSAMRAGAVVTLSVFAPRLATLVMFSMASLGRTTEALPRWLVWLTYAVGLAMFVNVSISAPSIYSVPAWIAVVSVVLLVRRPPHGLTLTTPAEPAPR